MTGNGDNKPYRPNIHDLNETVLSLNQLILKILTSINTQWTFIEEEDAIDELSEFIYANTKSPLPNTAYVATQDEQKNIDFFFQLVIALSMKAGNEQVLAKLFVYLLWQSLLKQPGYDIKRIQLLNISYEDEQSVYTFPPIVVIFHTNDFDLSNGANQQYSIVQIDLENGNLNENNLIINPENVRDLLTEADLEMVVTIDDVANSKSLFDSLNDRLMPVVNDITTQINP